MLRDFMDVIRGGFDKGFGEARDILSGLGVFTGAVEADVTKTRELVLQGYDRFLQDRLPGCDAILFGSDILAAGALSAARRRKVSVPADIAIAGFGDNLRDGRDRRHRIMPGFRYNRQGHDSLREKRVRGYRCRASRARSSRP